VISGGKIRITASIIKSLLSPAIDIAGGVEVIINAHEITAAYDYAVYHNHATLHGDD
jgi:hypothetical protein